MTTTYITPRTYNALYSVMQYENALALRVALETGARIGDVVALRRENLHGLKITYTAQKTGKTTTKKVSLELMRQLLNNCRNEYGWVFGGRDARRHRTRQAVWKDVKKAAARLQLQGNVAPHSARKTYAVELMHEKGLPAVQSELQHDRTETTMLYAFADLLTSQQTKKEAPQTGASEEIIRAIADLLHTERMFWLDFWRTHGIIRTAG